MAHENMDKTDFTHLKYGISGGSACPEQVIKSWQERTGSVFLEGYGMSEAAPITQTPPEGPHKLLSVGIAPPKVGIKIVDLETGETVLPTRERGEICIKGPQVTQSYCNRPEETANSIRDGWFYTGDIGYLDEDGYLFLVDRKKEMIIVGGYNVYPREIDELLHKHPAVHEAAAIGVPHEFRGEEVKAYVSLYPGESVTEEELIEYCAENLAKYKVPTSIEFLDGLPKTAANKINKLALKAHAREGK
jgi:long-chain acyl-CoA synthetase